MFSKISDKKSPIRKSQISQISDISNLRKNKKINFLKEKKLRKIKRRGKNLRSQQSEILRKIQSLKLDSDSEVSNIKEASNLQ